MFKIPTWISLFFFSVAMLFHSNFVQLIGFRECKQPTVEYVLIRAGFSSVLTLTHSPSYFLSCAPFLNRREDIEHNEKNNIMFYFLCLHNTYMFFIYLCASVWVLIHMCLSVMYLYVSYLNNFSNTSTTVGSFFNLIPFLPHNFLLIRNFIYTPSVDLK